MQYPWYIYFQSEEMELTAIDVQKVTWIPPMAIAGTRSILACVK
jgi:hypothetical protein